MGFMDWLMKGVDEPEVKETKKATFDEKTLENLRNISSNERQQSTTINGPMNQMPSGYAGGAMQSSGFQSQQPMQPNCVGGYNSMAQAQQGFGAMQPQQGFYGVQNMGMPAYGYQNAYVQTIQNPQPMPVTMTMFKVSSEEDVKMALKHLGKKSPCVISFEKMNRRKQANLYQFLSGGVFALGATMVNWVEKEYLLTPRGMEITRQDKAKK